MAKKVVKLRSWTKEDIRTLKTLARKKENNCDCTYVEAKRRGDTSAGI